MRAMLIFLPVAMLIIGILFGYATLVRAAVFFLAWMGMCMVMVFIAVAHAPEISYAPLMLLGIILMLPSMWMAMLVGFTGEQKGPAPAVVVYESYQGLEPKQKDFVHKATAMGAKVAAGCASDYLRRNGYTRGASALKRVGDSI